LRQAILIFLILVVLLSIGIGDGSSLISHPCKVRWWCIWTASGLNRTGVSFPLPINPFIPFPHSFLVRESDDEILNSRISFPEDLNGIGAYVVVSPAY
tara:strand:- start:1351 stop:1644 length:294 start_codon:yes stop_codon:yes gene_type:complete